MYLSLDDCEHCIFIVCRAKYTNKKSFHDKQWRRRRNSRGDWGTPGGGGTTACSQEEYRPGTRQLAGESVSYGLDDPWSMFGAGPVPSSLEDGETGPN